jgi:hypothetical protein
MSRIKHKYLIIKHSHNYVFYGAMWLNVSEYFIVLLNLILNYITNKTISKPRPTKADTMYS